MQYAVVLLLASTLIADPTPPPRTVTVNGKAVVRVVPDRVAVSVGAETFDASLEKAVERNAAIGRALIDAFHSLGVTDRNIETDTLTLSIVYVRPDHPARGIEGYYAKRRYTVTVNDPALADRLLQAALKAGANQIFSVSYDVADLRPHRDDARKRAARAAREKAETLATELGAKLGSVRTISETADLDPGVYGYLANTNFATQDESAPTVAGGEVEIAITVNVTFDLVTAANTDR